MKILKQYRTEQEAVVDSLVLKELGINYSIIKNDGGPYPSLTDIYGYSIYVSENEFESATAGIAQNMTIAEPKTEQITPENDVSKKPSSSAYLYFGIAIGICIGVIIYWSYSKLKYFKEDNIRLTYKNGLASSAIADRNRDKLDDHWQYWKDDGTVRIKADNNYDGEVDYWWVEKNSVDAYEKRDCDFNGIIDETSYYEYYIITKKYFHPNNPKKLFKVQYFTSSGGLDKEYIDTDSSGGMDLLKQYDKFENVVKKQNIKDTIIHF